MVLLWNKKIFNGYWISMGIFFECHYRDKNAFKSLYRFMTQISFFFSSFLFLSHSVIIENLVLTFNNSCQTKKQSANEESIIFSWCLHLKFSDLTFGRHCIARAWLALWKLKWKYQRDMIWPAAYMNLIYMYITRVWQLLYLQHWCIWCAHVARTRKKISCVIWSIENCHNLNMNRAKNQARTLVNSVEQLEALFIHSFVPSTFFWLLHAHIVTYTKTYRCFCLK